MRPGPRFPLLLTAAVILLLVPISHQWQQRQWLELTFGGGAVALLLTVLIFPRIRREPPAVPERSISILLVEDTALIMEFIMAALVEGIPALVQPARTKAEAQRLLSSGHFDAALVDLGLPDGSGMDLIHHIRAGSAEPRTHRSIPIVILSGIAVLEPHEVLQASGADEFLVKPFLPKEAVSALQRLMRDRTN
jgi:CheY-like chemotaxis protein